MVGRRINFGSGAHSLSVKHLLSYLPLLWCYVCVDCTKSKTNKMELLYRGDLIQTCLSIGTHTTVVVL